MAFMNAASPNAFGRLLLHIGHDSVSGWPATEDAFALGRPLLDGRPLAPAEIGPCLRNPAQLAKIDGQFLLVAKEGATIRVATDRFLSIKLYHAGTAGSLVAGEYLIDVAKAAAADSRLTTSASNIFEFLHFRRYFGTDTAFENVKLGEPATLLTFTSSGVSSRRYWQPSFKAPMTDTEAAEQLATALRSATKAAYAGRGRVGLLLSGGLDARALLAANAPDVCITVCPSYNNEARVAERLARMADVPFDCLERKQRTHDGVIDRSVFLSDGEHFVGGTTFIGYDEELGSRADEYALGLYLDVLFGGLYLPKSVVRITSRPTTAFRLDRLEGNLAEHFVNHVKYRLNTSNLSSVIKDTRRKSLIDALHAKNGSDSQQRQLSRPIDTPDGS